MTSLTKLAVILIIVTHVHVGSKSQTRALNESSGQAIPKFNSQKSNIDIRERANAARALLKRAPLLKPAPPNVFTEDEFIALARVTVEGEGIDVNTIKTLVEAVESLEKVIKLANLGGGVGWGTTGKRTRSRVLINSSPQGLKFIYRRTVDHLRNTGTFLSGKTDAHAEVEPAVYTFIITRASGAPDELTVDCLTDCLVNFK